MAENLPSQMTPAQDATALADRVEKALTALLSYQQADEDGVMVLTSRQAIHEVADELKRLRATSQTPDAVRKALETAQMALADGLPNAKVNPALLLIEAALRSTPSASAGPQAEAIEQLCEGITDENRHPEIPVSALVPNGFALVPLEPTKEMIQVAIWALDRWREKNGNVQGFVPPGEKYQIRWRAMLAAAPAHPQPQQADGRGAKSE